MADHSGKMSPDNRRLAALVVCGHAMDVSDAAELLDELGLLDVPPEFTVPTLATLRASDRHGKDAHHL